MEGIDKILEPLGELPVLVRTLQVFQSCDLVHEVIVVTREDLIVPVSQLCRDFMLDKVTKVMVGGAERVLSVRIGVQEARRDAALIAIHDGARPLLSREEYREAAGERLAAQAFDDDCAAMVSFFVRRGKLSAADIAELKRLLDEQETENE